MKKVIVWFCLIVLNASFCFGNELERPLSFSDIAEKAIPAVVTITTETKFFDLSFGSDPDSYWEYFRFIHETLWPPMYCHGSGFFISPDGYLVTNAHVVEDFTSLLVAVHGRNPRLHKATVVGVDPYTDLAVLKIDSEEEFPYLEFGSSYDIRVSDPIMVIGSPATPMLESSIAMGNISSKERYNVREECIEAFIQTDAAINEGNSGGPVLNHKGKVIGIVDCGFCFYEGLNFLIPSHTAKAIVNQILANGEASYGFLGIRLENDDEQAFGVYTFPCNDGAHIREVFEGSPAENGGLKTGDVIREVNGCPIVSQYSLKNQLFILEPNTEVDLAVERDGEILYLSVVLDKWID